MGIISSICKSDSAAPDSKNTKKKKKGLVSDKQRAALKAAQQAKKAAKEKAAQEKKHEHDMSRARKKFEQLDQDDSGFLEGDELLLLAEWVLTSFDPEKKYDADDKERMKHKLIQRMDTLTEEDDEDGEMYGDNKFSFDEFQDWYLHMTHDIYERRHANAEAKKEQAAKNKAAQQLQEEIELMKDMSKRDLDLLSRAHERFDTLDKNHNGSIEGKEMDAMADWTWQMFHPDQTATTEQRDAFREKLASRHPHMEFSEYHVWFAKTCKEIEKFRQQHFKHAAAAAAKTEAKSE